jgi:hypothetical protein
VRALLFLAAATLLHADSFSYVSVTSGDCPTQTAQSATGASVSAEAECFSTLIGGIGSNGSVSAGGSFVSVDMHSVNGGWSPLIVTAYSRNTSTALLPGDGFGMAVMEFQISGLEIRDGTGIGQTFAFTSGSKSETFDINPDSVTGAP